MNESLVVTLDVREDIRTGREPFSRIMAAVAGLRMGDQLLLVAPFEPVPLFSVLAKQGFRHVSKQTSSKDWEVLFTRENQSASTPTLPAPSNQSSPSNPQSAIANPQLSQSLLTSTLRSTATEDGSAATSVDVDTRGLEPPQPMVIILEALATLPAGAALQARTDRKPMHLYAQLEARGFVGTTEEQSDGSFITEIRAN